MLQLTSVPGNEGQAHPAQGSRTALVIRGEERIHHLPSSPGSHEFVSEQGLYRQKREKLFLYHLGNATGLREDLTKGWLGGYSTTRPQLSLSLASCRGSSVFNGETEDDASICRRRGSGVCHGGGQEGAETVATGQKPPWIRAGLFMNLWDALWRNPENRGGWAVPAGGKVLSDWSRSLQTVADFWLLCFLLPLFTLAAKGWDLSFHLFP